MGYELRRQPNGSFALFNPGLRETMHPHLGPWLEATQLYVGGTGLEALLAGTPPGRPKKRRAMALAGGAPPGDLVVFDVGLGGAANSLAAIACRDGLARQGRKTRHLVLVSFEQDLEALAFTIANAGQLGYARGHLEALAAILERGSWEGPGVRWELRQGNFVERIGDEPRRADVVFYDPFSHRTNPAMWSVPVLESVYRCRRPGSGQRLVTYSSAYSVRAAFLLAGFYVGEGVRLEGRPTTIAVSDFADLDEPLDSRWMARWRKDKDPWPALTSPERHRALRDALIDHPQWTQLAQGEDGGEGGSADATLGPKAPWKRGPGAMRKGSHPRSEGRRPAQSDGPTRGPNPGRRRGPQRGPR